MPNVLFGMAKSKQATSQDRKRVSSEAHEIQYTGGKVAKQTGSSRATGKKAVKKAKSQTASASRKKVEPRARKIAKKK